MTATQPADQPGHDPRCPAPEQPCCCTPIALARADERLDAYHDCAAARAEARADVIAEGRRLAATAIADATALAVKVKSADYGDAIKDAIAAALGWDEQDRPDR